MKKKIIWLTLICIIIPPFSNAESNEDSTEIATLEQTVKNATFSLNGNNNIVIDGTNIATLTINNNKSEGYKIYVTADSGKLTNQYNSQYVSYTLTCHEFTTNSQGLIVPEVKNIRLTPNTKTLIYNVVEPPNDTIMATATCDLIPDSGQNLKALLATAYTDNMVFSME